MRLTALVDSPDHVCCRYRLAAFRPYLEQAGHTLQLLPWPRSWQSWLRLPSRLQGAEVVILQRKLLSFWQLGLVRAAAPALLFDVDDAVFLRSSYSERGAHSGQRRRRFANTVRLVDGVIAGNDFVAAHAAQHLPAERVTVVPTCVDPERYPLAQHAHASAGEGVDLVWIGSSSTLQGLERIQPLLEGIGRHCPCLRLKLICDRFLSLEHLPVVSCPWTEASEAADLAAADVGISWLPEDDWSRGKCGLKVLQYMAAGLPVVANPVGVQAQFISHGETGFLAETAEEWRQAITLLAADPELRRTMGAAGRRRVEADFSVRRGAQRWLDVLSRLAAARDFSGGATWSKR